MSKMLHKDFIRKTAFIVAASMVLSAAGPGMGAVHAEETDQTDQTGQTDQTDPQPELNAPDGIYGNGRNGINIDVNDAPYTTYAEKDYGEYAYGPEGCAWFAAARANQITGVDTLIWDGNEWYNNQYSEYGFTRGTTLQAKAIVCYGWHVAIVERVDGDIVTVSEGGYSPTGEKSGYTRIFTTTKEKLESDQYGGFLGYVYLKYDESCNTDTPLEGSEVPDEDLVVSPEDPDNTVTQNGWLKTDGKWQYLADGEPVAGRWVKDKGNWYYLDQDSYMVTGWLKWKDNWYYLSGSGAMLANAWLHLGDKWYYLSGSGVMLANTWVQWKNEWYFFGGTGAMLENTWVQWKNEWYFFGSGGEMLTGAWVQWKNAWYYLSGSGAMAKDTWIGTYYVGSDGIWIPGYVTSPAWRKNSTGWWYFNGDGTYPAKCWKLINEKWYYFDEAGYMKTGWILLGGTWYYLTASGAMAHDCWIGNYYMGSSGAMYVNAWTPDGYYVGADGAWIPNM